MDVYYYYVDKKKQNPRTNIINPIKYYNKKKTYCLMEKFHVRIYIMIQNRVCHFFVKYIFMFIQWCLLFTLAK